MYIYIQLHTHITVIQVYDVIRYSCPEILLDPSFVNWIVRNTTMNSTEKLFQKCRCILRKSHQSKSKIHVVKRMGSSRALRQSLPNLLTSGLETSRKRCSYFNPHWLLYIFKINGCMRYNLKMPLFCKSNAAKYRTASTSFSKAALRAKTTPVRIQMLRTGKEINKNTI